MEADAAVYSKKCDILIAAQFNAQQFVGAVAQVGALCNAYLAI